MTVIKLREQKSNVLPDLLVRKECRPCEKVPTKNKKAGSFAFILRNKPKLLECKKRLLIRVVKRA